MGSESFDCPHMAFKLGRWVLGVMLYALSGGARDCEVQF